MGLVNGNNCRSQPNSSLMQRLAKPCSAVLNSQLGGGGMKFIYQSSSINPTTCLFSQVIFKVIHKRYVVSCFLSRFASSFSSSIGSFIESQVLASGLCFLCSCFVVTTALNFRFLWLKNKAEINLFENLHSFKVAEVSDLISWLDFLLDNLFICFGHCAYRQCFGIPMGTNCAVYLANFYLLTYEFDFINHLLNSKTCPVMLHRFSMVYRPVDLFVPYFRD
jgi:hypothetical protein